MPPLETDLAPRFKSQLRELPADRRLEIAAAISALKLAFGKPHDHLGLGIRKLRDSYFEFRVGSGQRIIFKLTSSNHAVLAFIGSHDDIRRFLRGI